MVERKSLADLVSSLINGKLRLRARRPRRRCREPPSSSRTATPRSSNSTHIDEPVAGDAFPAIPYVADVSNYTLTIDPRSREPLSTTLGSNSGEPRQTLPLDRLIESFALMPTSEFREVGGTQALRP